MGFVMKTKSLHRSIFAATMFAVLGLAFASGSTAAQEKAAAKRLPMATITVTAAPYRNIPEISRMTVQGHNFLVVSASVPVPYSDLNLAQATGADELGRRIRVAARMACQQIDMKYPPHIYAQIGTDDCQRNAADTGMAEANIAIAAAR
jgi:UrcA family protein